MRTAGIDRAAFGRERASGAGRFSANRHPPTQHGAHAPGPTSPPGGPMLGRPEYGVALMLWRTTVRANVMGPPEAGPAARAP